MDGITHTLSYRPARVAPATGGRLGSVDEPRQRTLRNSIGCVGTGLHTGHAVALDLYPAGPGNGIGLTRTDLDGDGPGQRHGPPLPASYAHVVDTRLCTVLGAGEARFGTVEHLLAALAGIGIDNALITLDGPEVPILDGSAEALLFLIDCAGIDEQAAPRRTLQVIRPVRVTQGEAFAELLPLAPDEEPGFHLQASIDFPAPAIGRQGHAFTLTPENFRHDLAAARTFTDAAEITALHGAGLALGGSLDNAVVVDGDRVLNPGGLRMEGEFIRHKLLDVVGDLALAGAAMCGRFIAHRPGHALNNQLLRALFADPASFRLSGTAPGLLLSAA